MNGRPETWKSSPVWFRLARTVPLAIIFGLIATASSGGCSSDGDGNGVGRACLDDETLCGGVCTHTNTDPENCGSCGNVCNNSQVCIDGLCKCPDSMTDCGGTCTNTSSDPLNCGSCDNVCPPGQACINGHCGDCGDLSFCDGFCVDTNSDPSHCGTCGHACPTGQVCQTGVCTERCDPGFIDCDGACVDPDTSTAHCGSCGNVCDIAAGFTCSDGVCTCPPGKTDCQGICADTTLDPAHCGACNRACETGMDCCDGECIDLNSDAAHCGACNHACKPTEICCQGSCSSYVGGEGPPLISQGPCGTLLYGRYANQGQSNADHILPDFSFAGYRGGGVRIPIADVRETISPAAGDDRARIQAAIDAVSALPLDAHGLRGAVLLKKGNYEVSDTLWIKASGVVLRGEGQGPNDTVLTATKNAQHDFIAIQGEGSGLGEVEGTRVPITDKYVPVGSRTLTLTSTSPFSIGDPIVVLRTPNQTWIQELDMAQWGWTPESYVVGHERTIVDISNETIVIDIPIVDTMEDKYGGGAVFLSSISDRISRCGVESMRLVSVYNGNTDENHGWKAIRLRRAVDSWVRGVTAVHFGYSAVSIEGESKFNTVEDTAMIDPISQITGGRRYPFNVSGTSMGNLFQRCYSREGRHNFVSGARVPGPNVWLDCLAVNSHSDDGPHHRWATGLLFDNTKGAALNVQNRASSGTGHGWSGAQTLFWNAEASTIRCDAPRGAMNWAIGCLGTKSEGSWVPSEPFGWWESHGQVVSPRSLYLEQLVIRKGPAAVSSIALPVQLSGRIWKMLADWAGQGALSDYGPDPHCDRGIPSGKACCAASCGTCGGSGCSQLPGGAEACCVGSITDSGRSCAEVGPPCLMQ